MRATQRWSGRDHRWARRDHRDEGTGRHGRQVDGAWVGYIGGDGTDSGAGIAVDTAGDAWARGLL